MSSPASGRPGSQRSMRMAVLVSLVAIAAVVFAVDRFANSQSVATPEPPSTGPIAASPLAEAITWIDATPRPSPEPEPTIDPMTVAPCIASDLGVSAWGWGGATGSMAGGATLINMSVDSCRVAGKPGIGLFSNRGEAIAVGAQAESGTSPVVLQPGGLAGIITVWMNWCGDPPVRPLFLHLSLPDGGGLLEAMIRELDESGPSVGSGTSQPRCDAPNLPSTIGVPLQFSAPEPSSGDYEPAACTAHQLAAYLGGWGAAGGASYASGVVLNVGGLDCLLVTSAPVELRDADGKLLVNGERWPDGDSTFVLPAGWAAVTTVEFANWCLAPPKLPFHFYLLVGTAPLELTPTSERSRIGPPFCMSATQTPPPSLGYTGPFRIPGTPEPPEPNPVDTMPVSVAASALPPTRAGDTLVYTVTITSNSPVGKPIDLGVLCPTYAERLFLPTARKSIDRQLLLNCAAAGILAPGASLAFDMRLPIPADAASGIATLVWQLGDRGPAFKAAFEIAP